MENDVCRQVNSLQETREPPKLVPFVKVLTEKEKTRYIYSTWYCQKYAAEWVIAQLHNFREAQRPFTRQRKLGREPWKNQSRPYQFCRETENFTRGHRRLWPRGESEGNDVFRQVKRLQETIEPPKLVQFVKIVTEKEKTRRIYSNGYWQKYAAEWVNTQLHNFPEKQFTIFCK